MRANGAVKSNSNNMIAIINIECLNIHKYCNLDYTTSIDTTLPHFTNQNNHPLVILSVINIIIISCEANSFIIIQIVFV